MLKIVLHILAETIAFYGFLLLAVMVFGTLFLFVRTLFDSGDMAAGILTAALLVILAAPATYLLLFPRNKP